MEQTTAEQEICSYLAHNRTPMSRLRREYRNQRHLKISSSTSNTLSGSPQLLCYVCRSLVFREAQDGKMQLVHKILTGSQCRPGSHEAWTG